MIIRSLHQQNDNLLIGTQSSEIFELNMKDFSRIECICSGHAEGELWSLATSPENPDIFATASDDQTVRIWNMRTNKLLKVTELENKIRSCSFNADGSSLACGLSDGTLVILKTE